MVKGEFFYRQLPGFLSGQLVKRQLKVVFQIVGGEKLLIRFLKVFKSLLLKYYYQIGILRKVYGSIIQSLSLPVCHSFPEYNSGFPYQSLYENEWFEI